MSSDNTTVKVYDMDEDFDEYEELFDSFAKRFRSSVMTAEDQARLSSAAYDLGYAGFEHYVDEWDPLAERMSQSELEMAGEVISKELAIFADGTDRANTDRFVEVVTLALVTIPVLNAFSFSKETRSIHDEVMKLWEKLTQYWSSYSGGLNLNETHRIDYARGVLVRASCTSFNGVDAGYFDDLYTQWIGRRYRELAKHFAAVMDAGDLSAPAMQSWTSEEDQIAFLDDIQFHRLKHSFASEDAIDDKMYEINETYEVGKNNKGDDTKVASPHDRVTYDMGNLKFTVEQLVFWDGYHGGSASIGNDAHPVKLAEKLVPLLSSNDKDDVAETLALILAEVASSDIEAAITIVSKFSLSPKHTSAEIITGLRKEFTAAGVTVASS